MADTYKHSIFEKLPDKFGEESFNEMMWCFMMSVQNNDVIDYYFKRGMTLIYNPKIDPFDNDYQLLRELRVRRWTQNKLELIYEALVTITGKSKDELNDLLNVNVNIHTLFTEVDED
jgi:hypothetical protein